MPAVEPGPVPAGNSVVSVVMIFWNAEKFIGEAIDSVLAQTVSRWELVLVDDGSTDRSTAIARSYAAEDPGRILYVEHPGHANRGMSASRNTGILHCSGRYIAFLDSDDAWLPHKLERQLAIMESVPSAMMVFGASRYWHSWTGAPEDAAKDYVVPPGVPAGVLYEPPSLFTRLYPFGEVTTPPPSDFLVRREAIDAVKGFEEEFRGIYQLFDDQAFLVKMYLHAPIFASAEEWDNYRIHPDSCDSMATKGGHYFTIRGFFLKWFERYLRGNAILDPAIWRTLRDAVHAARARLHLESGASASLLDLDDPGARRIAIDRTAGGQPHDVQLNLPYYETRAGQRYLLRFEGRASQARGAWAGVAQAHAPWATLGCRGRIELTTEWRPYELEFTATADDDNARVHFDVGEARSSVELRAVSLLCVPEGDPVLPGLPEVVIPAAAD